MKESADRIARFVDDLLHGRRPHRFEATREEAEAMTAAAGLAAARVGADIPEKAALDRIHQKLSEALDESPALDRASCSLMTPIESSTVLATRPPSAGLARCSITG